MPRESILQLNFTSGEWSPRLDGRADLAKYYNACLQMKNMLCYPQGPAFRRPGTKYIATAKDSTKTLRLIPFEYSDTDAYILEFSDYLIRFYRTVSGVSGLIQSGGANLELVSPYADDDLPLLDFRQVNDVMYIPHPDYAPYQLNRYSHTSWTTEKAEFVRGPFLPENDTDTTIAIKTYAISAVSAANETFTISGLGDLSIYFEVGATFTVFGSTGNDGSWTVSTTSYAAPDFTITVTGNITNAVADGTIKPDISKGRLLRLVSSIPIFDAEHEDSLWQLKFPEPSTSVSGSFTSVATSNTLTVAYGQTADMISKGVWAGVLIFEVSYDGGTTWGNLYTATGDTNVHVPFTNDTEDALIRAKMSTYTSGTCKYDLVSHPFDKPGALNIQTVWDAHNVDAVVMEEFGSSNVTTKLWSEAAWSDYRGWPRAVCLFEQRLIFAGSYYNPTTLWFSRAYPGGDYMNFEAGTLADSSFAWTLAESQNPIEWIEAGDSALLAGTSGGEFVLSSGQAGEPLSAEIAPKISQPGVQGSDSIRPIKTNVGHLFVERNGKRINEIAYNWEKDQLAIVDMTRLSEHLVAEGVKEIAFQRRPEPVLWCVLDDGSLASLIYLREEDIVCWCAHETDGDFESVAVIPGTGEDEVFFVIKRNINGSDVRYIEKLMPWDWGDDQEDGFFVDCGLTYDSTPTTTITGLSHLEGETVAVLADGGAHPNCTVSGGSITLNRSASVVHVGLPYTSNLQPMKIAKGTMGLGSPKRIVQLALNLYQTGYVQFGPDTNTLEEIDFRSGSDLMDTAVPLVNDVIVRDFAGGYDKTGAIILTSNKPLPFAVRSITLLVESS